MLGRNDRDEFAGNIDSSSVYETANGKNFPKNVADPRPRVAWIAGRPDPLPNGTRFMVDNNNRYIDLEDSGGNTETFTIPRGGYTGPTLAAAIEAELIASTHASAYVAGYNVTAGKFEIFDPSFSAPTIQM